MTDHLKVSAKPEVTEDLKVREEQITLRAVTEADDVFVLAVYGSTRAHEMASVPWSEEQKEAFVKMQYTAQKQHYAAQFPKASHDVIVLDGTPVGRLYVNREEEALHILDVTVLPEYRSRGAGALLLRRLLREADALRKPVTIYVESFNPSVRFFERLGFLKAKEDGFQLLMKWQPHQ